MKRILTLVLVLAMIAALPLTASAAGKMVSTQETLIVTQNRNDISCYCFAKIENTGNKPMMYNDSLVEFYNTDGDMIDSVSFPRMYGQVLQPGEYSYFRAAKEYISDVTVDDVDDYLVTITGKSVTDEKTVRIPCTTAYNADVKHGYREADEMSATFTNDTEETLYDVNVVLALLDSEGKILYVYNLRTNEDVGLLPGSSMTARTYVPSDIKEAITAKGLTIGEVDAYAYVDFD